MNLQKNIFVPNINEILDKYPDKIPVIIDDEKKTKVYRYLVCNNMTVAQFLIIFRKKINISTSEAIYMYVKKTKSYHLITTSSSFGSLYETYKTDNNILVMKYAKDNVFG